MPEWRKCTYRERDEHTDEWITKQSRYAETDGTYTVCACKAGNEWRGVLWKGKQMIAVYNSPREAKAAAYDYQ